MFLRIDANGVTPIPVPIRIATATTTGSISASELSQDPVSGLTFVVEHVLGRRACDRSRPISPGHVTGPPSPPANAARTETNPTNQMAHRRRSWASPSHPSRSTRPQTRPGLRLRTPSSPSRSGQTGPRLTGQSAQPGRACTRAARPKPCRCRARSVIHALVHQSVTANRKVSYWVKSPTCLMWIEM